MRRHLSTDEAISELRKLCDQAGGVCAFAKKVGLSPSAVSHQLNGHRPIQGKVAKYMGIKISRQTSITYKRR